jgi:microcystin-dependent protein
MAQEDPLWMQANDYEARLDRALIEATLSEGVVSGCSVTQRSEGANMSVDVNPGRAVIKGDDIANQGSYLAAFTTKENKAIGAAHATLTRKDIVVYRINDTTHGGAAGNNSTIAVIAGTAAASPVVPTTPASALLLAVVTVNPGATSITNANILESRIGSRGYGEVPFGAVMPWACADRGMLPAGWLVCDGAEVSRDTYFALFALCGTAFGAGNGTTTFNLPDLRQRFLMGADDGAGPAPQPTRYTGSKIVGSSGGSETKSIATANLPSHTHLSVAHAHNGQTSLEVDEHVHGIGHSHPGKNTAGANQGHTHSVPNANANGNHAHNIGNTGQSGSHGHGLGQGNRFLKEDGGIHLLTGGGAGIDVSWSGNYVTHDGHEHTTPNTDTNGEHTHGIDDTGGQSQSHVHNFEGYNLTGENSGNANTKHRHDIPQQPATATSATGSGTALNVMNPLLAITYIVRAL